MKLRSERVVIRRLLVLTCVVAMLGVSKVHAASGGMEPYKAWVRAIVTGEPEHLVVFDKKLKEILGYTDLEAHQIGCMEGCNALGTAKKLIYHLPRDEKKFRNRFARAWDETQADPAVRDPSFALQFDADISPVTCNPVSQPNPPCQNMSFCPGDQCGRKPLAPDSCSATPC